MDSLYISEMLRGDYPQPNCPVCGRFAKRSQGGTWEFSCMWYVGSYGDITGDCNYWEHE